MLPWNDLHQQIQNYVQQQHDRNRELADFRSVLLDTLRSEIDSNWEQWKDLIAKTKEPHLYPDFDESPASVHTVSALTDQPVITATDGSQIFSSHHEITPLSLISVSKIRFDYYDVTNQPILETNAEIFDLEALTIEDGNIKPPSFETGVSDKRTLDEMKELVSLSRQSLDDYGADASIPIVALSDGSLILWGLAGRKFEEYEKRIVEIFIKQFDRLQSCRLPVAGYISNSNSREVVQLIELVKQEASETLFDRDDEPAKQIYITDTNIFSSILSHGERSAVFHSRSKILQHYREHSISYFYLHVGSEVAKVEIPRWVANDDPLLDRVAAVCLQQADYGSGYPMILSEAHEQAVIRSADRETFYTLVEQEMLRQGLAPAMSPKLLRKRASIV